MARPTSSRKTTRTQYFLLLCVLTFPTTICARNGTCGLPWGVQTSAKTAQCTTIESFLPGKVFYKDQAPFAQSMSTYWTAQEADHPPACIVTPINTRELLVVVQSLKTTSDSRPDNPCYFAVRSGGSGHDHKSNEPDGVNIDLRSWKVISLSQDRKIAHIHPGYTFAEIYTYLDRFNLTVAGARFSTVGIGGYSLGGGISYLSPQVGFGSDTVVNFEVVLSTGEIVNANASSNPDLHLALRGGQNNFGVVTRVDISTFPLGKVHGGTILQNVSTVSGQLKTLHQFAADTDYDEKSNIIQSFGFDGQRVVVVNTLVYMHATPVLPATLQQFVDLGEPISNSIRTASLSELMGDTGTGPVKASRHVVYTTTIKPSVEMLNTTFSIWNASTADLQMSNISYTIAFEPVPSVLLSQSANRGGNMLGLTPSDGPLIVVLLTAAWQNSKFDTLVDNVAKSCIQAVDQAANNAGMLHRYKYIGYAEASQEVLRGYGEQNLAFMKNVSEKYDPGQIFQNLVRGGFKLADL